MTGNRFKKLSPFLIFSIAILFIGLGDAVLSYVVPIYLEENLGDQSKMGIILALSSVAGVVFDLMLGKSKIRSSRKFFIWAFFSALILPISIFFFPPIVPVFITQMVVWGLYYELIAFSSYSFINERLSVHEHARSWGIMSVFRSISYTIGPIIAGYTVDISLGLSTGVSAVFFLVAILIFAFFLGDHHKKEGYIDYEKSLKETNGFGYELKVWYTLLQKIWPIYLFLLVMTFVDSGFWTIGVLFSEELSHSNPLGQYFLVAYMLPGTFMGFLAGKLAKPFGKKRISLFCGVISGLFMFILMFFSNIYLILLAVFVSSAFISISSPEISATFEDYISRLGGHADDMIGLQQTAISIGYVIGPVLLGLISFWFGNKLTFSILGFILMIISVISMVFTPRKIKMPQKALEILEEEE